MISVALCTYNGECYIYEQVESILNQTMPVDEIVVCDDGSSDNTLQIIEGFVGITNTAIHIHSNETNLGPAKNFQKAINLCSGDIIFLSDQDDVWVPEKVATIIKYFEAHPTIDVVFTDGNLMADNTIIGSLWQCFGITPKAQKTINEGFCIELFAYENRATGATMAVRRDFKPLKDIIKYCHADIIHDGALAMMAANSNQLGYINERLINYRIHTHQECGVGNYLKQPLSDDKRNTSYIASVWSQLPLPSPLSERIAFIVNRNRRRHQPLGAFRLLKTIPIYISMYGNRWLSFLSYDIRQWASNMLHRINIFNSPCTTSQS